MKLEKILLVDDEPDIRTIGELALSTVGGWQVVTAASGSEAVRLAAQEQPDLILLDVMMPLMDGPATFRALRAQASTVDTPVIFMTARVQRSDVQEYLDLGAVGVIAKPFEPMTLPDQIRRIAHSGA